MGQFLRQAEQCATHQELLRRLLAWRRLGVARHGLALFKPWQ